MKKDHSKFNEPENIPQMKITYFVKGFKSKN